MVVLLLCRRHHDLWAGTFDQRLFMQNSSTHCPGIEPAAIGTARASRLSTLVAFLFLLGVLPGTAQAQEPATPASEGFIHSLLIDKQSPILGIKWGAEIFIDSPLNNEPEGADLTLRRAQFHLQKRFSRNWLGKLTLNYNNAGAFDLGDNYLLYSGWQMANAQLGVFDPPFSLESVSQSAGLTFMERSLVVNALSESKAGGVGVLKRTAHSIFNAGVFFVTPENEGTSKSGQAFVLHYVHAPVNFTRLGQVHLGGSFSYRINANPDRTELKTRPEVATADDYYVDTGTIAGADKVMRFGLEAFKQSGRLSWQSEILATGVDRTSARRVTFWGAYTYLSWFLTNDQRNYDAGTGKFLAMTPSSPLGKGGKGAFELALRASYVDLTDKDVIGGRQANVTVGLNWYLNRNFRFMTNLVKVLDVDRPGSEYDGLDPLIFSLRFQWQIL